ncbi:MAG: AAA family ATPase [Myxococcales bacterium]|nr:AAA family ATPase [Myxococcales bacterium]
MARDDHEPLLAIWILRALLATDAYGAQRPSLGRGPLDAAGLGSLKSAGMPAPKVKKRLVRRLDALVERGAPREGPLFANVTRLGSLLALSAVEQEVLLFAVLLSLEPALRACFDELLGASLRRIEACIGATLDVPLDELRRALAPSGALQTTGLVLVADAARRAWDSPLAPMDDLPDVLYAEHADEDALLARLCKPAPPSALGVDDFAHVERDLCILQRYLASAAAGRLPGANVLLYGAPGTGKTELVRCLARELGAALVEVEVETERGAPLTAAGRLAHYRLCQALLGRRRAPALVAFDEIEDVFPKTEARAASSGANKGFTNRLLEHNRVPAIWISNHVSHIDPAFVRRFDFVLELAVPPAAARRRIVEQHVGARTSSARFVATLAADERFGPAHLARAVRVGAMVAGDAEATFETTVLRVLANQARAQGAGLVRAHAGGEGPYELRFLNTSHDPAELVTALARHPSGAICLYGPPGTGKTALVHHVAERIGLPLVVKRASDILSPWVGETEANLAAMFARASEAGAILFLDEADGFLRNRSGADRTFEVTQVNELLVQLEGFEGLFFCATNAFDTLDPAALRRFALKIRFDGLSREQRWELFTASLRAHGALGSAEELAASRASVDGLDGLTPGDFAAVTRQARILGRALSAPALSSALEAELRHKRRSGRAIAGFLGEPARASRTP